MFLNIMDYKSLYKELFDQLVYSCAGYHFQNLICLLKHENTRGDVFDKPLDSISETIAGECWARLLKSVIER
jgi:hypothetical protein